MTEEEAKTKWCPFVRVAAGMRDLAYNRAPNDSPIKHTACIGSACMAWRETHRVTDANVDPRDGYCGLAGKK